MVKKGSMPTRPVDISERARQRNNSDIKLPFTLAIVEGLLVEIGDGHFVLPLSIVEECVELTGEDARKSHGRNIANIRGEIVPYIRLQA